MKSEKLIFILFLTTIVLPYTKALFWRRRRRRCDSSNCSWIWGSCSRTCGGGYQSPVVTKSAGSCGSCNPPSRRSCNIGCCPVNCQWGSWSSYGTCSTSCEDGTSVKTRSISVMPSCGGSSCSGSSTSSRTCNNGCCPVDCQWMQWTGWDACSKTCGKGTQTRHRSVSTSNSCGGAACHGSAIEERYCNDHCCPVDCQLSEWSEWEVCSVTCGTGTQTRSRNVTRQKSCDGNACQGHMDESQNCNHYCCPVDCKMNQWNDWSECSATCGPSGVSARNRSVAIQPICGGASCPEEREQTRACNRVCMNNGTMTDESCTCTPEWSGECCQKDVDECAANPCGENTECRNMPGSFECSCRNGFKIENCSEITRSCNRTRLNGSLQKDGTLSCRDINECVTSSHNCHEDATCKNGIGSFECHCNDGFTGDGTECENFDECVLQLHDCDPNARCIDHKGTYDCICKNGFVGDGILCTDIDECAADPCGENTKCKNIPGSFECSCKEGFNKKNCSDINGSCNRTASEITGLKSLVNESSDKSKIMSCRDINECITSAHDCHEDATCMNVIGSFDCCCNDGFTGDGKRCRNFDECILELHGCDSNALCFDREGTYDCKCKDGFDGNGIQCSDIDECSDNPCGENMECKNVPGSFECACKEGFKMESKKCDENDHGEDACANAEASGNYSSELDPQTDKKIICIDIDECTDSKPCTGDFMICHNLPGSYECNCPEQLKLVNGKCEEENFEENLNELQSFGSNHVYHWKNPVLISAGAVAGILLIVFLVLIYRKRRPRGQRLVNASFKFLRQSDTASVATQSINNGTEFEEVQSAVYE